MRDNVYNFGTRGLQFSEDLEKFNEKCERDYTLVSQTIGCKRYARWTEFERFRKHTGAEYQKAIWMYFGHFCGLTILLPEMLSFCRSLGIHCNIGCFLLLRTKQQHDPSHFQSLMGRLRMFWSMLFSYDYRDICARTKDPNDFRYFADLTTSTSLQNVIPFWNKNSFVLFLCILPFLTVSMIVAPSLASAVHSFASFLPVGALCHVPCYWLIYLYALSVCPYLASVVPFDFPDFAVDYADIDRLPYYDMTMDGSIKERFFPSPQASDDNATGEEGPSFLKYPQSGDAGEAAIMMQMEELWQREKEIVRAKRRDGAEREKKQEETNGFIRGLRGFLQKFYRIFEHPCFSPLLPGSQTVKVNFYRLRAFNAGVYAIIVLMGYGFTFLLTLHFATLFLSPTFHSILFSCCFPLADFFYAPWYWLTYLYALQAGPYLAVVIGFHFTEKDIGAMTWLGKSRNEKNEKESEKNVDEKNEKQSDFHRFRELVGFSQQMAIFFYPFFKFAEYQCLFPFRRVNKNVAAITVLIVCGLTFLLTVRVATFFLCPLFHASLFVVRHFTIPSILMFCFSAVQDNFEDRGDVWDPDHCCYVPSRRPNIFTENVFLRDSKIIRAFGKILSLALNSEFVDFFRSRKYLLVIGSKGSIYRKLTESEANAEYFTGFSMVFIPFIFIGNFLNLVEYVWFSAWHTMSFVFESMTFAFEWMVAEYGPDPIKWIFGCIFYGLYVAFMVRLLHPSPISKLHEGVLKWHTDLQQRSCIDLTIYVDRQKFKDAARFSSEFLDDQNVFRRLGEDASFDCECEFHELFSETSQLRVGKCTFFPGTQFVSPNVHPNGDFLRLNVRVPSGVQRPILPEENISEYPANDDVVSSKKNENENWVSNGMIVQNNEQEKDVSKAEESSRGGVVAHALRKKEEDRLQNLTHRRTKIEKAARMPHTIARGITTVEQTASPTHPVFQFESVEGSGFEFGAASPPQGVFEFGAASPPQGATSTSKCGRKSKRAAKKATAQKALQFSFKEKPHSMPEVGKPRESDDDEDFKEAAFRQHNF